MLPEAALLALLVAAPSPGVVDAGAGHSGVAMAEDDSRLATNPALLGSDPSDRALHARLSVLSATLPMDAWRDLGPRSSLILRGDADALLSDEEFLNDLWKYDGRPVSVRNGYDLSAWKGDWAASAAISMHPGVRVDHGIVVPSMEAWDSCDIHLRGGLAQAFGPWRVGAGLHVRGQSGSVMEVNLRDPTRLGREIRELRDSALLHIRGGGSWSAGVDLGVLRTLPHGLQAGARLGDLGLRDADGDLERPVLDAGIAWIPEEFRAQARWPRRLALGAQLRDLLADGTPLLGHLDLGAQARQSVGSRNLEFRASTGLRGGWPSAGLGATFGMVLFDCAAWAEDLDPVLGRTPLQNWDVRIQLGW